MINIEYCNILGNGNRDNIGVNHINAIIILTFCFFFLDCSSKMFQHYDIFGFCFSLLLKMPHLYWFTFWTWWFSSSLCLSTRGYGCWMALQIHHCFLSLPSYQYTCLPKENNLALLFFSLLQMFPQISQHSHASARFPWPFGHFWCSFSA